MLSAPGHIAKPTNHIRNVWHLGGAMTSRLIGVILLSRSMALLYAYDLSAYLAGEAVVVNIWLRRMILAYSSRRHATRLETYLS